MAAVIPIANHHFWARRENHPPTRQRNAASRSREYLTPDEMERMIIAARQAGEWLAERDALLIMTAHHHGLRAFRAHRGALGSDRPKGRYAYRPKTQARLAFDPSVARTGIEGLAGAWYFFCLALIEIEKSTLARACGRVLAMARCEGYSP
jgi:hypothetical protein